MPFNNNGTFERVHNWVEDKENNIAITASRIDAEDDNFANGLSQTLLRDGSVALSGNLNLGNNKIANLANGTASNDAVNKNQLDTKQNTITGAASTVTTNNLVANKVLVSNSSGKITNDSRSVDDIINTAADSNKIVHIAGTETITGTKTFTAQPQFAPGYGIRFNTDNGSSEHYVMRSSGNPSVGISMFLNNDTTKAAFSISPTKIMIGSNTILPNSVTPPTSDNSTRIATTSWVNSVGNNVVHRTGNETIAGTKTFSSDIRIANNQPCVYLIDDDAIKGTNPQTQQIWAIYNQEPNNLLENGHFGVFTTHLGTDGTVETFMSAYKNTSGSTASESIRIAYPTTGSPYTYAPTPTDAYTTTNGTQITNTGWVASGFVNLNYGQTITGSKTFTSYIREQRSNPQVVLINTDVTTGTSKNYDQTWWLRFEDTNGRTMGAIRSAYLKDSTNTAIYMRAIKSGASGDTDFADLSIHYPSTGNPFAEAPSSDRNGSILTTVNKSKSSNGYFQLGNGMIVQWGKTGTLNNNASSPTSTTFPTPFTSSNYKVILTVDNGTTVNNEYGLYVVGKTTTAFTAIMRGYEGGSINRTAAYIAIGY